MWLNGLTFRFSLLALQKVRDILSSYRFGDVWFQARSWQQNAQVLITEFLGTFLFQKQRLHGWRLCLEVHHLNFIWKRNRMCLCPFLMHWGYLTKRERKWFGLKFVPHVFWIPSAQSSPISLESLKNYFQWCSWVERLYSCKDTPSSLPSPTHSLTCLSSALFPWAEKSERQRAGMGDVLSYFSKGINQPSASQAIFGEDQFLNFPDHRGLILL